MKSRLQNRTAIRLVIFTCFLAAGAGITCRQPAPDHDRPNLIFILADDLGYGDVGFNGQQKIKTPNLDKLAGEGIRFTRFYAGTSVCAPSRSSLMSGFHTGHTYIRGNKRVEPEGQQPIADSVVTIAELLRENGYATGAFGKWGLGSPGSEGDPLRQGFDHFFGYNCQTLAHRYYPAYLWDNDKKVMLDANENLQKTVVYAPDLIQDKALEFVASQDGKKPFFMLLPYILPHAELVAPDDSLLQYYKGKFPETPFAGNDYGPEATKGGYASQAFPRATFAAMVARLDMYVGQIVEALRQKGLDKNTLIIFTSDNGPHVEAGADPVFFNSNGGFRGVKRDLYEGGIRVPTAAYWPGVVKPGISHHAGAFWDILPTFTELAGIEKRPATDGISLVPTLLGKGNQSVHDYLYWEFHEKGGRQAVSRGDWKALRLEANDPARTTVELYDLSKDPQESDNLAETYPEKTAELVRLMDQAHRPSALFPFAGERKQRQPR